MTHADLNHELSDEDRDQLATMLSRVVGGKISNLETLDGFLTALVICPEPIQPSEFVPLNSLWQNRRRRPRFRVLARG